MNNEYLILPSKPDTGPRVEIGRSFSFKLNMGNYESRDFFCSQKAECKIEDSERVSQALHDFCKSQVMRAVREYRKRPSKPQSLHIRLRSRMLRSLSVRAGLDRPSDDYNQLKARIG